MRWYGQIAVIAVLAGAGYGIWIAHQGGYLQRVSEVPVVGPTIARYLPPPPGAQTQGQPGSAGPGRGAPPGGPTTVLVDTVKTGRVVDTRQAVGTVRALESVTITSKIAGIIEKIGFEEGERIKAGAMLVQLDADERQADIATAEADIRRAVAQRDELRPRLERAQSLRRSGSGTEAQVEDLTAQLATLDAAIASAEARRRAAQARLEDAVVKAPFSGRVGTRAVSLGAYVSPGTRITTLDDLSRVRLDFSVPENLLGQVEPGQIVRAVSVAFRDRVFEGKVTVIDPRVEPATRTVKLTAEFDNPDETLKPGMFLSVALDVSERNDAVVVPEEAVVSEGLRHILFVVKDGQVERRVVRIGQRLSGRVEIVEGVKPDETIVVQGVQRVRPGASVVAKPIGAEGPAIGRDAPKPLDPETKPTQPAPPPAAGRNAAPAQSSASPIGSAAAAERAR